MMIDSNVLIYALNPSSPKHKKARDFIAQQKNFVVAQQNILEILRVITHTKFEHPLSAKSAIKILEKMLHNSRTILPSVQTSALTLELVTKYSIVGNEIFDAYLVATSLSNGIHEIATDNVKHLGKYTEIKVINPFS